MFDLNGQVNRSVAIVADAGYLQAVGAVLLKELESVQVKSIGPARYGFSKASSRR